MIKMPFITNHLRRKKDTSLISGFTLIETLVIVTVTAFMFITLGSLTTYFYKTNAYTLEQSTAVGQARRGVEDSMKYLREASYGSDGAYPIGNVSTSSIVFYANINNSSSIERVTYSLQSGTFYRTVEEPWMNGSPPTYVGAAIATTTIAVSVVNPISTPIFRYFDNTGAELFAPINISNIASIKTTIVIDVNLSRAPVAFTLSGGATLRNLHNQL